MLTSTKTSVVCGHNKENLGQSDWENGYTHNDYVELLIVPDSPEHLMDTDIGPVNNNNIIYMRIIYSRIVYL